MSHGRATYQIISPHPTLTHFLIHLIIPLNVKISFSTKNEIGLGVGKAVFMVPMVAQIEPKLIEKSYNFIYATSNR